MQPRQARAWWNPELWPDVQTVADVERRKLFFAKLVMGGLCASLLFLSLGWLFERMPKPKDERFLGTFERPSYKPQSQHPINWVWRIATDGPFGVCGAVTLSATLAVSMISFSSLYSQLEKARKKESLQHNKPTT